MSPALQADSLPSEPPGKPQHFTSSQQVLKNNAGPWPRYFLKLTGMILSYSQGYGSGRIRIFNLSGHVPATRLQLALCRRGQNHTGTSRDVTTWRMPRKTDRQMWTLSWKACVNVSGHPWASTMATLLWFEHQQAPTHPGFCCCSMSLRFSSQTEESLLSPQEHTPDSVR